MRLALYQPDIPQNAGGALRLAACLGLAVDIIEPCGFLWDDKKIRRAGMDYIELATLTRHSSWDAFCQAETTGQGRLVLVSTKGAVSHTAFAFRPDDILLMGRESCGVPDSLHDSIPDRVAVPQCPGTRSLNVVTAAAIVCAEALRQTALLPAFTSAP
ncbi:tRNA (cytidine(34)-2'-O)-methyltransferase [Insolitispirillum peregrinum]|uniref:tRNA (cytidine(34)-2'-O)-methyltransferase n=1 Tax=Insolitispirillum peregrinum TaxID=80876 RepID=UPI003608A75A